MICLDRLQKRDLAVRWLCIALTGAGVLFHLIPYFYDHSLWVDESMLASSILTRSFAALAASPLDNGQSAPVGYLYLVKAVTALFGRGEGQLRAVSFLSYLGCIILLYLIGKACEEIRHPAMYSALFALLPYYISYTVELKPYVFDTFIVLLAALLYMACLRGRLPFWGLCAAYSLLVWCSFAACFYIASVMMILCVKALLGAVREKKPSALVGAFPAVLVLLSFAAYYFLWLAATNDNAGAKEWWDYQRFPLIPKSMDDLRLIFLLLKELAAPLQPRLLRAAVILCMAYRVFCWLRDRKLSMLDLSVLLCFALLLIASALGFYPITGRLALFFTPPMLLLGAEGFDALREKFDTRLGRAAAVLGICLLALNILYVDCRSVTPDYIYQPGSEVAANKRYLDAHLTDDDMIYVIRDALPTFLYVTGYRYGNVDIYDESVPGAGNVLFGRGPYDWEYPALYQAQKVLHRQVIAEEAQRIAQYDSVYIWTSTDIAENREDVQMILEMLRQTGQVDVASCSYQTYLYHYTAQRP